MFFATEIQLKSTSWVKVGEVGVPHKIFIYRLKLELLKDPIIKNIESVKIVIKWIKKLTESLNKEGGEK